MSKQNIQAAFITAILLAILAGLVLFLSLLSKSQAGSIVLAGIFVSVYVFIFKQIKRTL